MQRRRYSREQWLAWLQEQPGSGLSIAKFCRTKGVSENSFYVWRRKLGDHQSVADRGAGQAIDPFIPLTVVENEPVQIRLPCGATVQVGSDASSLRLVLRILLEWSQDQ